MSTPYTLPPAGRIAWIRKPLSSAHTHFTTDRNGVFHLHIRHGLLQGVTPAMLGWWFRNIGGDMNYQGARYPKYHVWHPEDHIHWNLARSAPDGSVGPGARFRIVEAFGRNHRHRVDSTEEVTKLDDSGIRLCVCRFGQEIFSLEHQFLPAGTESTQYISDMRVGMANRFGRFVVNPLLHRLVFTRAMGHAWLKHNIEEVGHFEHFLPDLYRSQRSC